MSVSLYQFKCVVVVYFAYAPVCVCERVRAYMRACPCAYVHIYMQASIGHAICFGKVLF